MERDFYKLASLSYHKMYDEILAASQGMVDLVKNHTVAINLLTDENATLRDELAAAKVKIPKPAHPTMKPVSEETRRVLDALFAAADANTKLVKKVKTLECEIHAQRSATDEAWGQYHKMRDERESALADFADLKLAYEALLESQRHLLAGR